MPPPCSQAYIHPPPHPCRRPMATCVWVLKQARQTAVEGQASQPSHSAIQHPLPVPPLLPSTPPSRTHKHEQKHMRARTPVALQEKGRTQEGALAQPQARSVSYTRCWCYTLSLQAVEMGPCKEVCTRRYISSATAPLHTTDTPPIQPPIPPIQPPIQPRTRTRVLMRTCQAPDAHHQQSSKAQSDADATDRNG